MLAPKSSPAPKRKLTASWAPRPKASASSGGPAVQPVVALSSSDMARPTDEEAEVERPARRVRASSRIECDADVPISLLDKLLDSKHKKDKTSKHRRRQRGKHSPVAAHRLPDPRAAVHALWKNAAVAGHPAVQAHRKSPQFYAGLRRIPPDGRSSRPRRCSRRVAETGDAGRRPGLLQQITGYRGGHSEQSKTRPARSGRPPLCDAGQACLGPVPIMEALWGSSCPRFGGGLSFQCSRFIVGGSGVFFLVIFAGTRGSFCFFVLVPSALCLLGLACPGFR